MSFRLAVAWLSMAVGFAALGPACDGAEGGGDPATDGATVNAPRFDGAAAYQLVRKQLSFGPRIPGTEAHRRQAEWMREYLAARADTLIVQRFEHLTVDGETIELVNVFARFNPDAGQPILFLAHWDTRPAADQAHDPEGRKAPVPGANDGASGTAVLLQLAEMLAESPPPRAVDILLVDGEDYGDFSLGQDVFLGSRHFAANMPAGYDPDFGVLLDMVGDRDLEIYVEGNSNRLAPGVVDRVWRVAARLGFGDVFHKEVRHTVNDDHIPLNEAGIPTINIIDFDYPYWHTPEDTADKVSASSLGVVGTVMARLAYAR